MANLANQYLREIIKKECWDAMVVKGRSVNAFHLPLSVSNYPMKERTKAELDEVQYVINQRKIEQAESAASKDVVSSPPSARNTPLVGKKTSCWFQRAASDFVLLVTFSLNFFQRNDMKSMLIYSFSLLVVSTHFEIEKNILWFLSC